MLFSLRAFTATSLLFAAFCFTQEAREKGGRGGCVRKKKSCESESAPFREFALTSRGKSPLVGE